MTILTSKSEKTHQLIEKASPSSKKKRPENSTRRKGGTIKKKIEKE